MFLLTIRQLFGAADLRNNMSKITGLDQLTRELDEAM
jgi:hypothetical protein